MGNICRSPMAEAIFKDLVAKAGLSDHFVIDSVGTEGYHEGEPAHPSTHRVLAMNGIKCNIISRQVTRADLEKADYIIAMDSSNASTLLRLVPSGSLDDRLGLLMSFAANRPRFMDVPDPYYTGKFEEVFLMIETGCEGLLAHIRQKHGV
jgi:protein-tyrosine phosphatase